MKEWKKYLVQHWSSQALSAALVGIALLLLIVAWRVHNPWLKAGILLYEVLP